MKAKWLNVVWGIILILAGGVFLTQNLGWVNLDSLQFWMLVFAGISLLCFASYFINGTDQWGWLFPGFIFAGVASTMFLADSGVGEAWVGAPVLAGVGLPFLAAYLLDRKQNSWALIPFWVLAVLVVVTLVADSAPGEVIGALVLFSIALPFLVVYLLDRTRHWALIPAFILGAIGVIPLLAMSAAGNVIGAFVLFLIAAPFFVVYLWRRQNWWAIIPAGILTTLALVSLFSDVENISTRQANWIGALLFAGVAATFGFLWLQRANANTDWAKYPAAGLAIVAVLTIFLGPQQQFMFPAILIISGLAILLYTLRKSASK
jgi:hypothetical protein